MRRTGAISQVAGLMAGDHVCWTYLTDAEHRATLSAYFAEGARAGQRLVYLAPAKDLPRASSALRVAGLDPERMIDAGDLLLANIDDVYRHEAGFDPDEQLANFRTMVDDALRAGYSGLRAAAECGGLLNVPVIREGWTADRYAPVVMT